jgi:hypothetical protein
MKTTAPAMKRTGLLGNSCSNRGARRSLDAVSKPMWKKLRRDELVATHRTYAGNGLKGERAAKRNAR